MKKVLKFSNLLLSMIMIVAISLLYSCKGDTGPIGPAGPAGADGVDGQDGANGQDGADGKDATIAIPTQADIDAYAIADGVNGARLYDHVINYEATRAGHDAVWDNTDLINSDNVNFFRCKSCHGWDLLGQQGVNIGKTPGATYPVSTAINLYEWARVNNIKTVFNAVKNAGGRGINIADIDDTMPDYTSIGDTQIWDLVKFLKETSHNANEFYQLTTTGTYPTGTKSFSDIGRNGDPVNGLALYASKCAGCHGADGSAINIYCKGEWLGDMFRNDPHEMQYKMVWGMPEDREHNTMGCNSMWMMPAQTLTDQDIRDIMTAGLDVTKFPDYN
jgi:Cytochrome c